MTVANGIATSLVTVRVPVRTTSTCCPSRRRRGGGDGQLGRRPERQPDTGQCLAPGRRSGDERGRVAAVHDRHRLGHANVELHLGRRDGRPPRHREVRVVVARTERVHEMSARRQPSSTRPREHRRRRGGRDDRAAPRPACRSSRGADSDGATLSCAPTVTPCWDSASRTVLAYVRTPCDAPSTSTVTDLPAVTYASGPATSTANRAPCRATNRGRTRTQPPVEQVPGTGGPVERACAPVAAAGEGGEGAHDRVVPIPAVVATLAKAPWERPPERAHRGRASTLPST